MSQKHMRDSAKDIIVSTDVSRFELDRIYDFLHHEAYWCKGIPRPVFDRSIKHSLCFGALLPDGGSAASVNAMLGFFELEKALYELSYERAHRPDWAGIPSQAIERMVAAYDAAESQQGDSRSAADA